MSENEVLKYEREVLFDTKSWIKSEENRLGEEKAKADDKLDLLNKKSKGTYNTEIEIIKKSVEFLGKELEKFKEAYDKPYFARIDFREYRKDMESFYIGKCGLGDMIEGDERVIDWRAPLADLYYSGTQGEAYYKAPAGIIEGELSLKRKFLFDDEQNLKECFDEGINEIILKSGLNEEGDGLIDEFLRINLENSTGTKLKDVVATIQKEQNDIIRAPKNAPLIIQGSAGSGKTTVALHRLAYLLYRYKGNITGEDILVIAPNKIFLDYISEVLPNLGVDKVEQKTFEELALKKLGIKGKVITKDKKLVDILSSDEKTNKYVINDSKIKGSMLFKEMLDRYIQVLEREDSKIEDITICGYSVFDANEIKRLFLKDLVKYPVNKRKDEIKKYFSKKLGDKVTRVLDKVDFQYEYRIARLKKSMEDSQERRQKLIALYDERDAHKSEIKKSAKKEFSDYFNHWKGINTANVYRTFFEDKEVFEEVTAGKIPGKLADYMRENLAYNIDNKRIDSDDLAAMLYLKIRIEGIDDNNLLKHIVIDEAQDYSMFQLYVMSMMAANKSLTIVGDIGQGIYSFKGIDDWQKTISLVYDGNADYKHLSQSYRSTVEIIKYANKVLLKQNHYEEPAKPVLRHGMVPQELEFTNAKDFCEQLDSIVKKVKSEGKSSVAIVGKTLDECKKIKTAVKKYSEFDFDLVKDDQKEFNLDLIIIPSYLTKGLEFDCTIVYNLSKEIYDENSEMDKKLLYVVLTRALHYEYIFFKGEKSPLID
ncbi:RNA polymerase recycling motor HelD [Clostridium sp. B9]|uniref:RNA polymerase recycling motor HelD n=1 Tax=Clostridium sp. B9 TaxID=3423224 RepID=UPI003D2F1879